MQNGNRQKIKIIFPLSKQHIDVVDIMETLVLVSKFTLLTLWNKT